MVKNIPLTINRATTKTYAVRIKNKNKEPIDITGWTFYFCVKENALAPDSSAVINKKVIATIPNSTNGIVLIPLSDTDTDLDVKEYKYGLKLKTDIGLISMIAEGIFRLNVSLPKESL